MIWLAGGLWIRLINPYFSVVQIKIKYEFRSKCSVSSKGLFLVASDPIVRKYYIVSVCESRRRSAVTAAPTATLTLRSEPILGGLRRFLGVFEGNFACLLMRGGGTVVI